ncbi:MAG: DNA primase [Nitrospinae bacterium]|nr:DNA primase [Nitrospinota bacterium]
MGQIPDHVIEEVRRRADIVEVISGYLPLKKSGANFRALCPFHQEKSPSFNVNPQRQIFHCFGCGEGGNVISFVMKREGIAFPEAVRFLAKRYGVAVPETGKKSDSALEEVYAVVEEAVEFYHQTLLNENAGSQVRRYLAKRGLPDEMIAKLKLGWAKEEWDRLALHLGRKGFSQAVMEKAGLCKPSSRGNYIDRFRARLLFPIFSPGGKALGFGGRVLEDKPGEPKYLNSPETPIYVKNRLLYGFHLGQQAARRENSMIVVEGYMDLAALHRAGVENCVAVSGTAFTPGQAELIKRVCDRVTLLFDSDTAGVTAAKRSGPVLLDQGIKVRVLTLEGFKDPDEYLQKNGKEEFQALAAKAPPFHQFIMDNILKGVDVNDIDAKVAAIDEIVISFKGIKEEIERSHYIQSLADRTKTDPKLVRQKLAKAMGKAEMERVPVKPAAGKPSKLSPILNAERVLLRALMSHPEFLETAAYGVGEDEFSDAAHRAIFTLIKDLFLKGEPAAAADLLNSVQDEEVRRAVTSIMLDRGLVDEEVMEAAARDCAKRLRADKPKRKEAMADFTGAALRGDKEGAEKAQKKYFEIRKKEI